MKKYALLFLLLIIFPAPARNNADAASQDIPTITFCDLISSPELYDGREIRFRVKYLAGSEVAAFGDPNCTTKNKRTWAEFDSTSIKASSKPELYQKVMEQILCGKCGGDNLWRETEMIVTGIFNGEDQGYGHMGEYRFMVSVKSVEEIGVTEKTEIPGFSPK